MGCDIHDLVQVRRDGKWKTVVLDPVGSPRSYCTFAMLAGVRDCGDTIIVPIAEPRGLPDDLDHDIDNYHKVLPGTDVRETYLNDDGTYWLGDHSQSWLLLSEMKAYRVPDVTDHYFDSLIEELDKIANENEAHDDEVRYVFGFDS